MTHVKVVLRCRVRGGGSSAYTCALSAPDDGTSVCVWEWDVSRPEVQPAPRHRGYQLALCIACIQMRWSMPFASNHM